MLDLAFVYLRSGLCVLPAFHKEKRPALTSWKEYQERLPTEAEVERWFGRSRPLCILTGKISGNLEMIDFDLGGELFDRWVELVAAEMPGLLDRLVIERSQSGGRHVVYRSETAVNGNLKLAQRISDLMLRGPALPASAAAVSRVLHEAGYEVQDPQAGRVGKRRLRKSAAGNLSAKTRSSRRN